MAEDIMPTFRQRIQLNNEELAFFQKDIVSWQENLEKPSQDHSRSLEDLAFASSSADEGDSEDELVKNGDECLRNGEWSRAISLYSSALSRKNKDRYYAKRALASLRKNNLLDSEKDCSEAIRLNPEYTRAYLRRACVRKRLGKSRECCEDLEVLLGLDPDNEVIGIEYNEIMKFVVEEMASNVEELHEEQRDDLASKLRLEGNKLVGEHDYVNAKEKFTLAIKIKPNDPKIFANRAICFMKTKDFVSAEGDCDKALALDSKYIKIYVRRARVRRQLKKFYEARQDLFNAFELSENDQLILDELEEVDLIVQRMEEERRKKGLPVKGLKLWPIDSIVSGEKDVTCCVQLDWNKLKCHRVNAGGDHSKEAFPKLKTDLENKSHHEQSDDGNEVKYESFIHESSTSAVLDRLNMKEVSPLQENCGLSHGPFVKVLVEDAKFAVPEKVFEIPDKFKLLLASE